MSDLKALRWFAGLWLFVMLAGILLSSKEGK